MTLEAVYASAAAITSTNLNSLSNDDHAALPEVDNTTNEYLDALVGGAIQTGASGWAAGDSIEIFLMAVYSDTATDKGGAIGATGGIAAAGDSTITEGTEFEEDNLILLDTITAIANSTTYHWGPKSIVQYVGGIIMPPKWQILVHPVGGALASSGHSTQYIGIKAEDV